MNSEHLIKLAFLCGALLLGSAGCNNTTRLQTTWKDPAAGPIVFKRVAVVVLHSTPGERRAQEDTLAAQIKKATAVPSHTFVPDDELSNHAAVRQRIIQSGCDGAVVLRLVDSRKETGYVPGSTRYWNEGWSYLPYNPSPGYYVTDTIIRAEVSLYTVPEGKLMWVGSSTTANPGSARDFAMQVAEAAASELRAQGLLQ
jgi:hypothetical protein